MADRYPVGVSSFDDGSATSPLGKMQYVGTAAAATQVRSLIVEFAATPFAADGDRLSVNEAIRERPRQKQLRDAWDAYVARGKRPPVASLAAVVYTSTHDPSRANALDFGITMANGKNRAMTTAEAQWVHDNGPRRGIRWTGRDFRPQESWHHNAGYPATVAPIPDAPVIDTTTTPKELDMSAVSVLAATPSNVWYAGSPGHFDAIPSGQGELFLAMAGQTRPNVIKDSDVGAARDYFLHLNPVQLYAVVDGPNRDQWFVVGPSVFFRVPAGKGGDYEAMFGSRHAVSDAAFQTIRNVSKIGA